MSIQFVPGEGWVTDEGINVSAGSSDIARLQEQRAKKDAARRGMLGQTKQYAEQDNLGWLKNNIGDSWWWSVGRLPDLAEDSQGFWKEFGGRSDDAYARNAEIVNRYKALRESGMTAQDIQQAIFGNANLSPSFERDSGTVNNGENNSGVAEGERTPIGDNSSSGLGLFNSGSGFTGSVSGLGYTPQQMMPVAQAPKIDYAKMLNQALAQSMFRGMI